MVLLRSTAIKDVELWNTDPPITDILSLPNGIPTRILRLEVWLVATASRARLRLLVSCNHIFVTIFLREALGNELLLPGAPSIIFSLDDRRRDLGRVLDVLDLATSWGPAAVAPHAARGFLMNPSLLLVLLMRISAVEVVGLSKQPVNGRLAAAGAATLAGRLRNDDLLRFFEAIHCHGCRRNQWSLHIELADEECKS